MSRGEPAAPSRAAATALALAAGEDLPHAVAAEDWEPVLRIALRERLAAVAWCRKSEIVRAAAPRHVVASWRAHAVDADIRARAQVERLREALAAFALDDVDAVVLKGHPLSQRLYGDPAVRVTADVDLFVDEAQRRRCARTLGRLGWRLAAGGAPWEETWRLEGEGGPLWLEVHSTLLDHNLGHLPALPVEWEPVEIYGVATRALSGDVLPAYLASHAAKHRLPPLLWFLDLHTLWNGLAEPLRRQALARAERHRLHLYLGWALQHVEHLLAALRGDTRALAALGFVGDARHDPHPAVRDLRLAANPLDALRAGMDWAIPRPLRDRPSALAQRWGGRLGGLFTRGAS